jgi:hypothetical protein
MRDERDGASIGRSAGSLLADVLIALADGTNIVGPRGASRVGRAHAKVTFATHGEAGAWLQTPGLIEPVLLDVKGDEVRLLVPALVVGEGTSFDIVWMVRFAVDENGIATSEPAFSVAEGMDDLLDDFNDGLAAGLELHPRTVELRDGFGALGPYDSLDAS